MPLVVRVCPGLGRSPSPSGERRNRRSGRRRKQPGMLNKRYIYLQPITHDLAGTSVVALICETPSKEGNYNVWCEQSGRIDSPDSFDRLWGGRSKALQCAARYMIQVPTASRTISHFVFIICSSTFSRCGSICRFRGESTFGCPRLPSSWTGGCCKTLTGPAGWSKASTSQQGEQGDHMVDMMVEICSLR